MLDTSNLFEGTDSLSYLTELGSFKSRRDHASPLVLVVDDDVDNLFIVSYVLEQFDCLLVCETNGQLALDIARRLKPDLMVLDIRLPGMNGLDVVRTLRHHKETRSIPVIAVTALVSARYKQEVMQAGCDRYIGKPYSLEDMKQLMLRYLMPNSFQTDTQDEQPV